MSAVRHNPLIFYVLLVATFAMAYGVIWFTLSFGMMSVIVTVPAAAVVFLTGRKVCQ